MSKDFNKNNNNNNNNNNNTSTIFTSVSAAIEQQSQLQTQFFNNELLDRHICTIAIQVTPRDNTQYLKRARQSMIESYLLERDYLLGRIDQLETLCRTINQLNQSVQLEIDQYYNNDNDNNKRTKFVNNKDCSQEIPFQNIFSKISSNLSLTTTSDTVNTSTTTATTTNIYTNTLRQHQYTISSMKEEKSITKVITIQNVSTNANNGNKRSQKLLPPSICGLSSTAPSHIHSSKIPGNINKNNNNVQLSTFSRSPHHNLLFSCIHNHNKNNHQTFFSYSQLPSHWPRPLSQSNSTSQRSSMSYNLCKIQTKLLLPPTPSSTLSTNIFPQAFGQQKQQYNMFPFILRHQQQKPKLQANTNNNNFIYNNNN